MHSHGMSRGTARKHQRRPPGQHDGRTISSTAFQPWDGHLRDGHPVHIRPACESDVALEKAFVARLTPEAFAQCSLGVIQPNDERLIDELADDAMTEVRLLALVDVDGRTTAVGLARYRVDEQRANCDCAVAVDPAWRKLGIGSILMHHLIGMARIQGLRHMYAIDAARDGGAHALAGRLGFRSCPDPADPASVTFELELPA